MTISRISIFVSLLLTTGLLSGQAIDNLEQKLAAFNAAMPLEGQLPENLLPLDPTSLKEMEENRWSVDYDKTLMGPKSNLLKAEPAVVLSLHQVTPERLDLYHGKFKMASVFTDKDGKITKIDRGSTFIPEFENGRVTKLTKVGFYRGSKAKKKDYIFYRPIHNFSYNEQGLISKIETQKESYISPKSIRPTPPTSISTSKVVYRVQKSPATMEITQEITASKKGKKGKEKRSFTDSYTIEGNTLTTHLNGDRITAKTFDDRGNMLLEAFDDPKIKRTTKNTFNQNNHIISIDKESVWKVGKQTGVLKESHTSFTYDAWQNQIKKEVIEKADGKQVTRSVTTAVYDGTETHAPQTVLSNTGKNDYTVRTYDQNDTLIYEHKDGNFRKRDDTGEWSAWKKFRVVY
ncbi:hypothetical protein [Neolewinella persica]|uniref:hypothetical protein n=1 Tax=Neolewinella persica TaxID=70998 RepID=UPI00036928A1|nr:hypothetical protein [Neolewinella persica]